MISSLEVFSAQSGTPELPLGDLMANQGALQIRDIDGLGPVKADINTQSRTTNRGVYVQGTSVGARNIVITLGLNPDWVDYSVASLRQLLYRYFVPQQWVKLRFTSSILPPVEIEGTVEDVKPNIFTEDPEMQVSIICPLPDFIDPVAHEVTGVVQVEGETAVPVTYLYEGTVETGFQLIVGDEELALEAEQTFPTLDLFMGDVGDPNFVFQVDSVEITVDQYYLLNTAPGSKKAHLGNWTTGAQTNYLRNSRATGGRWPKLIPGTQDIMVAAQGIESTVVPWKLAYYNRYVGL